MEVWIADVFDYSGETPFLVGVFDSEQGAWDAIDVVINNMIAINPGINVDARFVRYVTPVKINDFTPACMDWCYNG